MVTVASGLGFMGLLFGRPPTIERVLKIIENHSRVKPIPPIPPASKLFPSAHQSLPTYWIDEQMEEKFR